MKPQTLLICKSWIQAAGDRGKHLASFLSPSDAQVFGALPNPIPLDREHLKLDLLDTVHFSWLAPYLRTLSQSEISFFLAAVSKTQAEGLKASLGFANEVAELTQMAKTALRKILREQLIQNQNFVPLAFLPEGKYNVLLDLTNSQLSHLIRYLGLHDLSFEMRQIIATKELKKIFSALSKKEGELLSSLMLHQEPLIFERLFLKPWDGSRDHLNKLLEERGVCRLGHALFEESESFLWYLAHRLDMHMAARLLKYRKKPLHARGGQILQTQVTKTLKEVR